MEMACPAVNLAYNHTNRRGNGLIYVPYSMPLEYPLTSKVVDPLLPAVLQEDARTLEGLLGKGSTSPPRPDLRSLGIWKRGS